ncbi:hypothetical protein [Corynebacterium aquilae]|uniref:Lipoprotein n=1 Tax=Corynebacterium aquilae DSM 44791 TaxID=1431546 RepID=A0A1L7CE65_9CORY|nr:hypothetical protein [Corynebacterium aquilae]APT84118.1 hypothetical protein CAQU_02445 [Corynebacterium aquilae DSM 44791]
MGKNKTGAHHTHHPAPTTPVALATLTTLAALATGCATTPAPTQPQPEATQVTSLSLAPKHPVETTPTSITPTLGMMELDHNIAGGYTVRCTVNHNDTTIGYVIGNSTLEKNSAQKDAHNYITAFGNDNAKASRCVTIKELWDSGAYDRDMQPIATPAANSSTPLGADPREINLTNPDSPAEPLPLAPELEEPTPTH